MYTRYHNKGFVCLAAFALQCNMKAGAPIKKGPPPEAAL
jgi:hypothetical protein